MTPNTKPALVSADHGHSLPPIESDKQDVLSSPYLAVEQAAEYVRVSKNYLDKLRVSGNGPAFVRLGRRKVLYRRSDLDKWVEEHIYASTTQYGR